MREAPGLAVPWFPHEDARDGFGCRYLGGSPGQARGGLLPRTLHWCGSQPCSSRTLGRRKEMTELRDGSWPQQHPGDDASRGSFTLQHRNIPQLPASDPIPGQTLSCRPWGCHQGLSWADSEPSPQFALAPACRLNSGRSSRGYGRKRVLARSGLAPTLGFVLLGSPSTRSRGTVPAAGYPKGRKQAALSCPSQRSPWPRQGRRCTLPSRGAGRDAAPRLRSREG